MSSNSEHLEWIHNRLTWQHGEDWDVDYMIRLREIIQYLKDDEDAFENSKIYK